MEECGMLYNTDARNVAFKCCLYYTTIFLAISHVVVYATEQRWGAQHTSSLGKRHPQYLYIVHASSYQTSLLLNCSYLACAGDWRELRFGYSLGVLLQTSIFNLQQQIQSKNHVEGTALMISIVYSSEVLKCMWWFNIKSTAPTLCLSAAQAICSNLFYPAGCWVIHL